MLLLLPAPPALQSDQHGLHHHCQLLLLLLLAVVAGLRPRGWPPLHLVVHQLLLRRLEHCRLLLQSQVLAASGQLQSLAAASPSSAAPHVALLLQQQLRRLLVVWPQLEASCCHGQSHPCLWGQLPCRWAAARALVCLLVRLWVCLPPLLLLLLLLTLGARRLTLA